MTLTAAAQAAAGSMLITVVPSLPQLAFRLRLPGDWQQLPVLADACDFSAPAALRPLGIFVASYGAIVFSVAARPAYANGQPGEWLRFLCTEQGVAMVEPGTMPLAGHTAATCYTSQYSDVGRLRVRMALFADSGRMVLLTAMAPETLWSAMRGAFDTMFASFALVGA